jgi:hypothetical protein
VSQFRSGEEVLQTARLQVDALGGHRGGLILEGADDRKLFAPLCFVSSQLVIAGGKSLVLEAHGSMREEDVGRFVFLVDCDGDGDVGDRGLRGRHDLIITEHHDVENDLLGLGALEPVVAQLVPAVASGAAEAADVAETVAADARILAAPVGCVRRAARARAISLGSLRQQDMDYFAIGTCTAANRRETALQHVSRAADLTAHQARRIRQELGSVPAHHDVCNGHDLVEAVRAVLIRDHRIAGGKAAVRSVDAMLRMTMLDPARREAWSVVARIRRWEAHHGRELLKP